MTRHRLKSDFWVPASLDNVWQLACDSRNLVKITPPAYGVSVECDGATHVGQKIRIRMAPFAVPVPLPWVATIREFQGAGPVRSFVDEQESGPFRYWRHRHIFEEGPAEIQGASGGPKTRNWTPGTWCRDELEYELPLMQAGELAHALFARRALEDMFAYRREAIKKLFGANE